MYISFWLCVGVWSRYKGKERACRNQVSALKSLVPFTESDQAVSKSTRRDTSSTQLFQSNDVDASMWTKGAIASFAAVWNMGSSIRSLPIEETAEGSFFLKKEKVELIMASVLNGPRVFGKRILHLRRMFGKSKKRQLLWKRKSVQGKG